MFAHIFKRLSIRIMLSWQLRIDQLEHVKIDIVWTGRCLLNCEVCHLRHIQGHELLVKLDLRLCILHQSINFFFHNWKGFIPYLSSWIWSISMEHDWVRSLLFREKSKKAAVEKKASEKQAAEEAKAQEKKAREEARIAERERKKAEALESKRYPIDDLQLQTELLARSSQAGESFLSVDIARKITMMLMSSLRLKSFQGSMLSKLCEACSQFFFGAHSEIPQGC